MTSTDHREVGKNVTVLIVEDELVSRRALSLLLSANGYQTQSVASAEEALRLATRGSPDGAPPPAFVLIDVDLPGMNGEELVEKLAEACPQAQPVLITAASRDRVSQTVKTGVPHLRKPLNFLDLLTVLSEKSPVQ